MADYSVTSESENLRLQMRRMMDGLHVAMPAKVLAFQPGPPGPRHRAARDADENHAGRGSQLPEPASAFRGARRAAVRADGGLSADRPHPAGGHRAARHPGSRPRQLFAGRGRGGAAFYGDRR